MARNSKELEARMSPDAVHDSNARVDRIIAEMPLEELRAARALTQSYLAKRLNKDQAAISKMERRADLYVSSLAEFINGMGGDLEIRAVFPEGAVRITSFSSKQKKSK